MYWLDSKYVQYSCGLWNLKTKTADEAQQNKLKHYAERLGIGKNSKGKALLDLGCGWGLCFIWQKNIILSVMD